MRTVLLVLGGVSIIASGLYTLAHLSDSAVFTVLVPGIVLGLILIGISVRLSKRRGHHPG